MTNSKVVIFGFTIFYEPFVKFLEFRISSCFTFIYLTPWIRKSINPQGIHFEQACCKSDKHFQLR